MNKEYKESSAFGVDFLKNEGEKIIQICSHTTDECYEVIVVLTNYGSLYEISNGNAIRLNPSLRTSHED